MFANSVRVKYFIFCSTIYKSAYFIIWIKYVLYLLKRMRNCMLLTSQQSNVNCSVCYMETECPPLYIETGWNDGNPECCFPEIRRLQRSDIRVRGLWRRWMVVTKGEGRQESIYLFSGQEEQRYWFTKQTSWQEEPFIWKPEVTSTHEMRRVWGAHVQKVSRWRKARKRLADSGLEERTDYQAGRWGCYRASAWEAEARREVIFSISEKISLGCKGERE